MLKSSNILSTHTVNICAHLLKNPVQTAPTSKPKPTINILPATAARAYKTKLTTFANTRCPNHRHLHLGQRWLFPAHTLRIHRTCKNTNNHPEKRKELKMRLVCSYQSRWSNNNGDDEAFSLATSTHNPKVSAKYICSSVVYKHLTHHHHVVLALIIIITTTTVQIFALLLLFYQPLTWDCLFICTLFTSYHLWVLQ